MCGFDFDYFCGAILIAMSATDDARRQSSEIELTSCCQMFIGIEPLLHPVHRDLTMGQRYFREVLAHGS